MMAVLLPVLGSWQVPAGVDPEVAELVERIVEERGGTALALDEVASLLESADHDPPGGTAPAGCHGWLPTLVLRVSWSPGRHEVVLYLSWPLG